MLRRCSRRVLLRHWGRIVQGFDAPGDKPRSGLREIIRFRWGFLHIAAELSLQLRQACVNRMRCVSLYFLTRPNRDRRRRRGIGLLLGRQVDRSFERGGGGVLRLDNVRHIDCRLLVRLRHQVARLLLELVNRGAVALLHLPGQVRRARLHMGTFQLQHATLFFDSRSRFANGRSAANFFSFLQFVEGAFPGCCPYHLRAAFVGGLGACRFGCADWVPKLCFLQPVPRRSEGAAGPL